MQFVFQVAVQFTDRVNWDGVQFCSVLASNETEATLIAAQLVGCRVGTLDGMVIGTMILDNWEA